YDIAASFVVVGLTASGVPYGAIDGSLTRLFFLICCKDDRTHLHVLARIGRMLQDQQAIDSLLSAETSTELAEQLLKLEQQIDGAE
ncbi:MAG: PTS fructose transporter subunit IIABC, partial [Planctomycetaceae bacterium]